MRIIILLLLAFNSYSISELQNIADIPIGSEFKFNMKQVQIKRKKCIDSNRTYRINNHVNLVNGSLKCNSPLFQRSCYIEFDTKIKYPSVVNCKLIDIEVDPHFIQLSFDKKQCPNLSCRPLMFTGMFTGPDLGIKSLKYNVGKYVDFNIEKGINLDPRSPLDKEPDHSYKNLNKLKAQEALNK